MLNTITYHIQDWKQFLIVSKQPLLACVNTFHT